MLVLRLGFIHVHMAMIINFILDFSGMALSGGDASFGVAFSGVHKMILSMDIRVLWFDVVLSRHVGVTVIKDTMFNLILISSLVSAICLTVVDAMLWLICMNVEMLVVLIGVITVGVAKLAAVESVMRDFVHGLFNDKVNWLMLLMVIGFTKWRLLIDLVGAAVLS